MQMGHDPLNGKITYSLKNGNEYAYLQGKSVRTEPGKGPSKEFQDYLGRPVDKEHSIFFNKEDGLFYFDAKQRQKIQFEETNIDSYKEAVKIWNIHNEKLFPFNNNEEIEFSNNNFLNQFSNYQFSHMPWLVLLFFFF